LPTLVVARLKILHRYGGINAPGFDELMNIEARHGTRYWVSEYVNEDHNIRKERIG
jgi:hypothetical protein